MKLFISMIDFLIYAECLQDHGCLDTKNKESKHSLGNTQWGVVTFIKFRTRVHCVRMYIQSTSV